MNMLEKQILAAEFLGEGVEPISKIECDIEKAVNRYESVLSELTNQKDVRGKDMLSELLRNALSYHELKG